MKAVMLSIQPKWCELIASGKKTVEVRKTKPKIDGMFKCYIYCTTDKRLLRKFDKGERIDDEHFFDEHVFVRQNTWIRGHFNPNKKVIGEFVCDKIVEFENSWYDPAFGETSELSCVGWEELALYLGGKEVGYGWHITDLLIYDKPKELSEFRRYVKDRCTFNEDGICLGRNQNHVIICDHLDCCQKEIKRPFQSWGYVEGLKGETE